MVPVLAALLLLLAPDTKIRSEKHGVGLWIPPQWKVVERDQEARVVVADGPKLGPGVPRLVLWNAGEGAGTLDETAQKLARQVAKEKGWEIVSESRKQIGPWPARRVALRFTEAGTKGRARFSVVLMGDRYYVLELSASAFHFPGATFDRIERSLEVPWAEETLPGGLVVETPAAWPRRVEEGRLAVEAPGLGVGRCALFLEPGGEVQEGAAGPAVRFLGKPRATVKEEREIEGKGVRMVRFAAEGWTAVVVLPVDLWEDWFPVMEEILGRARPPKE